MAVVTREFMHNEHVSFLNDWRMAVSEFGALTREFYIMEIGTWESYGGK